MSAPIATAGLDNLGCCDDRADLERAADEAGAREGHRTLDRSAEGYLADSPVRCPTCGSGPGKQSPLFAAGCGAQCHASWSRCDVCGEEYARRGTAWGASCLPSARPAEGRAAL